MQKSSRKPFLSAEKIGSLEFCCSMKLKAAELSWLCQGLTPWTFKALWVICVGICGRALTYTNFTVTFHIFTFLMSCHMGFISTFLKREFGVWCSYRCSRRAVLLLKIHYSSYKSETLDLWFMVKAAFGPGWGDAASPPSLLPFRECPETSREQQWAGARERGTSPAQEERGSPAVLGTVLAGQLGRRGHLDAAGMGRWENRHGVSSLGAQHLCYCILLLVWLRQLGLLMVKVCLCKVCRFSFSKEVTAYWWKAESTSLVLVSSFWDWKRFPLWLWAIILNLVFNSLFGDFLFFIGEEGTY